MGESGPSLARRKSTSSPMPKPQHLFLALLSALTFTLILVASAPAFADVPDTDAEARALYEAGRIAFDQGRFEAALRYFEASYELSGRPELLFNIGTVADRLRQDKLALRAFKRFLEEVPDTSERQGVLARIRILERSVARQDEHSSDEGTRDEADEAVGELGLIEEIGFDDEIEEIGFEDEGAEPAPQTGSGLDLRTESGAGDKSSGKRVGGLALIGAGGGVLAAGAIVLAVGQVKRGDIEGAQRGTFYYEVPNGETADRMTAAGIGAMIVGAGVLTGGILMLTKAGKTREDSAISFSVGPLGFDLRGEF